MMPKINVYLPDDLADAVRTAGVPVSAICQRALETAVKRMTTIRGAVLGGAEDSAARMPNVTPRARSVLGAATRAARDVGAPAVGTEHLLAALIEDDGNLAVAVLGTLEIQPAAVLRTLTAQTPPVTGEPPAELHFSTQAAAALELAVNEAFGFGHNYIGCEHVLLGLVTEQDGLAGKVLRELGADARQTRRAVAAAVTGFAHLRAQQQHAAGQGAGGEGAGGEAPPAAAPAALRAALSTAIRTELRPLTERIDRLETRLAELDQAEPDQAEPDQAEPDRP